MANQHSIDLQQDVPGIAESLARYLCELQFRSGGQSQDSQDWRSISKTVERMAIGLQTVARHAKCESGKRARYLVLQLIELTNELGPWLRAHGVIFTTVVCTAGDLVCIRSLLYDSAHHAAYCEARLFLKTFGFKLGPEYWVEDTFDPSDIIEDWDRARNAILDLLPGSWEEDFKDVPDRIRRERAALVRAESRQVSQAAPPNLHSAANQRGASNESANGQSSQLQSANLPVVNLELNQIRYAGKCHDVTADAALLVDGIVKAHPHWYAASKNDFSKPSKTKNSLPDPIKELIETQPGKGYRLKIK